MSTETTTISIPKPLAEKIKAQIKGTGFGSVSSWVTYVLRQVISSLETEDKPADKTGPVDKDFSKKDEEEVKRRLRALGYLS